MFFTSTKKVIEIRIGWANIFVIVLPNGIYFNYFKHVLFIRVITGFLLKER